jgi:hypothetical protein
VFPTKDAKETPSSEASIVSCESTASPTSGMMEVQTAPSVEFKTAKTCQTKVNTIGGTQIIETLRNVDKAVIPNKSTSTVVN